MKYKWVNELLINASPQLIMMTQPLMPFDTSVLCINTNGEPTVLIYVSNYILTASDYVMSLAKLTLVYVITEFNLANTIA